MTEELDLSKCSETDLWHHVAVHLEARGIGVVLVGGAVVAVYTEGAYRSGDLDFVPESLFEERIDTCMQEIGFHRRGRHYEHPDCRHLFVEFVSGSDPGASKTAGTPPPSDAQRCLATPATSLRASR